jgi:hypothetical protein
MTILSFVAAVSLVALQPAGSADPRAWFERTEQALMDAVASGDRGLWDRKHLMLASMMARREAYFAARRAKIR